MVECAPAEVDPPRRESAGCERFNELATRIETMPESRRTFLSNVAHELRTPVAIIRHGRAARGGCRAAEEKDRAIGCSSEIRNLTPDRDLRRWPARGGEAAARLQPIDTHASAEEAVRGLKQRRAAAQGVIENLVPPDLPGDRRRRPVRQVSTNPCCQRCAHAEGGLCWCSGRRLPVATSSSR